MVNSEVCPTCGGDKEVFLGMETPSKGKWGKCPSCDGTGVIRVLQSNTDLPETYPTGDSQLTGQSVREKIAISNYLYKWAGHWARTGTGHIEHLAKDEEAKSELIALLDQISAEREIAARIECIQDIKDYGLTIENGKWITDSVIEGMYKSRSERNALRQPTMDEVNKNPGKHIL